MIYKYIIYLCLKGLLCYLMNYCDLGLFGLVLVFYLSRYCYWTYFGVVVSFSISRIWLYASVIDVLCLHLWLIISFIYENYLVTHIDFLLPCIRIVFVIW